MEKTIHVSKESMERFKHDKDVVGATNRIPCPINNGADLNSDAMCDNLFEYSEYVEQKTERGYEVLGFILDIPFKATYYLNSNYLRLETATISRIEDHKVRMLQKEIEERLSDDEVEPEIKFSAVEGLPLTWLVNFYYRPEYAEQFNS